MPPVPSTDVRIRVTAQAASALRTFDKLDNRLARPRMNLERLNLQFRNLNRIWSLLAVVSGAALIKTFVGMASELQKTQLQIAAFTRDLDAVPAVMDSIIKLTEGVPFTLNTMTTSFVRMKASGLDPIVDAQGNGPLKDLADAVAAFGGGDEIFKRATIAIQQMAGKGVISMEELRQQLGEAIPVAMRIMAEQMGISVSKLITEVSRGNVEVEEGFDALFKGFREKFGGAGELLKTTFSGQLQQTRLEFEKLSKVILLDTGALDFLTSAIKLVNQQLNNLGVFLGSPEGTAAIDNFWAGVERVALFATQAAGPLLNLIDIVSSLVGVVVGITGSLPPELVGGGILGFMLFGRAGILPGVLFGLFGDEIAKITTKIAGWVGAVIGLADDLGLTNALVGGLIGFLLFGPTGGLIGLLIGIVDKIVQLLNKTVANLVATMAGGIANMKEQFIAGLKNPLDILLNNDEIRDKGAEAGEIARLSFLEKFAGEGKFFGDLETGLLAELKAVLGGAEGGADASAKAEAAVTKFMQSVRDGVPVIKEARERIVDMFQSIQDIGGLSPAQLTAVQKLGSVMERLREQAEGGGTQLGRFQASLATDLKKIDEIIAKVNAKIIELGESDTRVAGLRKEVADLVAMRDQMNDFGQTIIQNMGDKALGGIEPRIKRINEALNQFVTTGTDETPLLEASLDRVRSRFAGIEKTIGDLRRQLIEKTQADENQVAVLAQLDALTEKLNEGLKEQEARVRAVVAARQEQTRLANEQALRQTQAAVNIIELENKFDSVGLAVARAQERVDRMVDNANKNIVKIRGQLAKGLITQEVADEQIARWEALAVSIKEQGAVMVERMRFNASEWGKLMNSIAQSMEDSLGQAIDGLVKGTKTARDVLVGFYSDITTAVSKYLAKQALIGVFGQAGGGGGLGQIFGKFLTPFGSGGLFGAANGASVMLGGAGGVDQNVLSLNGDPIARVSRGETMTIDPTGGSKGDSYSISISAVDAKSVRALFMQEGSALVSSLQARRRLNRS